MFLQIRSKFDIGDKVFLLDKPEEELLVQDVNLSEEKDFESGSSFYRVFYTVLTPDGKERDYYEYELN